MNQSQAEERDRNPRDLKPLYVRSIVNSLGSGTVSPFLSVYAVKLGASASEMGVFQSVSNLAPSLMQVPWGKLSDKIGRRVPLIILGSIIASVLWIPLMLVSSANQLIAVIGIQAILGSMATPAWTALIGDLVHSSLRGKITSLINRSAGVGTLFATLAAGYLMVLVQGTVQEMFFIPLLIAVLLGVASSLVMLLVREKPHPNNNSARSLFSLRDVAKNVRSSPDFVRFCIVSCVFGFFMSMSWPLFTLTTVKVLNASMLEIALISVVQGVVTIALQPVGGRLIDRVGRKQLLVIYRLGLVLVPTFYALSTSIHHLYMSSVVFGVLVAFGDVAMFAYLLDVTREELRGTLSAFYNLVTGIVFFAGSLLGGYLGNYFIGVFGLVLGLQLVYVISVAGRIVGGLTFTTLREPYKYPSTLRKELWQTMLRRPSVLDRG